MPTNTNEGEQDNALQNELAEVLDGLPPVTWSPLDQITAWTNAFNTNLTAPDIYMTKKIKKKKTKKEEESPAGPAPAKVEEYKAPSKCLDGKFPDKSEHLLTVSGNVFKDMSKDKYKFYNGAGWVHISNEGYDFNEIYCMCDVTKKYICKTLAHRLYTPNSINRHYISSDAIDEKSFVIASEINQVIRKQDAVPVFDVANRIKYILANTRDDHSRICSYSDKRYMANAVHKIKGSIKYDYVAIPNLQVKNGFSKCLDCGNWFESESLKAYPDYNNRHVCEDCYNKFKFANAIGPWNFKEYPKAIYTQSKRLSHYYNENGVICATNKYDIIINPRLLGVEAEVELWKEGCVKLALTRFDMALRVKSVLGADFVSCKEDGTLTMNGKYNGDVEFDKDGSKNGKKYAGFEIVTCPADIEVHRQRWRRISDKRKGVFANSLHTPKGSLLLRAWDTDTCGFHVHVTKAALTTLQIGRMLKFVNSPNNAKFIHKIAGRGSDVFCRYHEKKFEDSLHPERVISKAEENAHNRARRVALNISNPYTVEFRIFRGTINPDHIMRNLMFVEAVCDFCYPSARSLSEIDDYSKFIEFVSKNVKKYKELAAWFIYQKQLSIRKIKEGMDESKLTIHPDMIYQDDTIKMEPSKSKAKQTEELATF